MNDEELRRLATLDAQTVRLARQAQRALATMPPSHLTAVSKAAKEAQARLEHRSVAGIVNQMQALDMKLTLADAANLKIAMAGWKPPGRKLLFPEMPKLMGSRWPAGVTSASVLRQLRLMDETEKPTRKALASLSIGEQARAASRALESLKIPPPIIGALDEALSKVKLPTTTPDVLDAPLSSALALSTTPEVEELVEPTLEALDQLPEAERAELADDLGALFMALLALVAVLVQDRRFEIATAILTFAAAIPRVYRHLNGD